MATGILSIGAAEAGIQPLSVALLAIAAAGYAGLVAIAAQRLYRSPHKTWDWLRSPQKGFGSFTFVAASSVLGARLASGGQQGSSLAAGLWLASLLSWLALSYGFGAALIGGGRLDPRETLTGGTFLTVVATQSLAALAALLASHLQSDALALAAVCIWLLGAELYAVLLTLIVARLIFLPFPARDFRPDSWIVMGALAITALAGAELASARGVGAALGAPRPFIVGVAIAAWAAATFLIPPLVGGELWRATRARPKLVFDPARWATVFPIAMYATASSRLGDVVGPTGLGVVGDVFFGVALAAWAFVALAGLGERALRISVANDRSTVRGSGSRDGGNNGGSARSAVGRSLGRGHNGGGSPRSGVARRGSGGVEALVRVYLNEKHRLDGDGPARR